MNDDWMRTNRRTVLSLLGAGAIATGGCLSLGRSDSRTVWTFSTDGWVDSSPAVADSTVYVGSFDSNVYALDADDGDEQWQFETDDRVLSSPAVADGTIYIGSGDDNVYALTDQ